MYWHYIDFIVYLVNLMRFVIILIKVLCMYVCKPASELASVLLSFEWLLLSIDVALNDTLVWPW